uniref:Uncharacterized protein n=1 Tax=Ditylenchus dipsaci TaxID=166011 RepID=A0A915CR50_9BILA
MDECTKALVALFHVCNKFKKLEGISEASKALDVGKELFEEIDSLRIEPLSLANVKEDLFKKINEIQGYLTKLKNIDSDSPEANKEKGSSTKKSKEKAVEAKKPVKLDVSSKLGVHQSSLQRFLSNVYLRNNILVVDWKHLNSCGDEKGCKLVKEMFCQTIKKRASSTEQ